MMFDVDYFYLLIFNTYLCLHNLTNSWSTVLLEKLTGSLLVKKFPAFYRNRRFITAFTTARHLHLFWTRPIQSMPPSHFLKIHLAPSTPGSSKWSLFLGFPHQNPACVFHLPHTFYFYLYIPTYRYITVKWSRYRPGVGQRVGRSIALLFQDRGTRRGLLVSSTPRPPLPR